MRRRVGGREKEKKATGSGKVGEGRGEEVAPQGKWKGRDVGVKESKKRGRKGKLNPFDRKQSNHIVRIGVYV